VVGGGMLACACETCRTTRFTFTFFCCRLQLEVVRKEQGHAAVPKCGAGFSLQVCVHPAAGDGSDQPCLMA